MHTLAAMKNAALWFARNRWAAFGLAVCLAVAGGRAQAAPLQLVIDTTVLGRRLQPSSLRYETSAEELFSVTRVSFLLSEFGLQHEDGSWLELTNAVAWIDFGEKRNAVALPGVPAGVFRSLRFTVGLDPGLNHASPQTFPAGHPLNPNLNGLHWNWQGGYVFMALEGLWRDSAGRMNGWSYHLARDTNAVRVTIPAQLETTNALRLDLDFDLAALLNTPRPLSFARNGSSTHSRDGDPVAAALVANLPGAFRLQRIVPAKPDKAVARESTPLYLPARFTAYPFRLSPTFPVPELPRDNPLLVERVALGRQLFREKILSKGSAISCASCHQASSAYGDSRQFSPGARGQLGSRHAMPLVNLAWRKSFFWDGRAPSLRAQALMPIQDHAEMDESLTNVVAKLGALRSSPNYPALFTAAFGAPQISPEKIGLALENYLLTLTSYNSKFDRVLRGQEKFTAEERRGFELFSTEYDPRRGQYGADCFHCHGGPLFQSQGFANNGLDSAFRDLGRGRVTGRDTDGGKFAVPSLRNVALTAPYMHDGRFKTLEEVVEHYSSGVQRSLTLDPNLAKHPNGGVPLSPADKQALVAFLRALTDDSFATGDH